MQYGWTIKGAIDAGATVSDIWNAVRNAADLAPGETLGASIFDMNYVAGAFRQVSQAQAAFGAAGEGAPISADMLAWAPWAQQGAAAQLAPQYQVRYSVDVTNEGATYTLWRSTTWSGPLEGFTTTDVLDTAQTSAESVASGETSPPHPGVEAPPWLGGSAGTVDPTSIQILRL